MSNKKHSRMEICCRDCTFSRLVTPEDDELPADVLIEHGRETAHDLSIKIADE